MDREDNRIDSALLLQANANIEAQYDIHKDVAVSEWSIDRNRVTYEKGDSHTLSLYLKGGNTSYRADQRGHWGEPGTLCLMPQGHTSDWHIGGPIHFVHLYFSDRILKRFASDHYEQDVRLIELTDLTYQADQQLVGLMLDYAASCSRYADSAGLFGEHLLYEIFAHIIGHYNSFPLTGCRLKGGLTSRQMKRVIVFIDEHLDSRICMANLATEADLSPFHFARQFKQSFGETPGQYVIRRRVEGVKRQLATQIPLAQIAANNGFAQQSHMTTNFKKQVGVTPNAYRVALAGEAGRFCL
ncbi:AraC family transcriptional regulator [Lacimicrobium alkaliphilum]|uniref:HTH araC/xylS-type domain-containing protein n=1 Tax=Lacimicrobium alkaliphilum TaxID=1526571 RepID=A0A0U3AS74_9ALTE|nr:AraC family transcriptional regulator [Lacimicrobium alkaliphilum]ALS96911.1 hypothetical protein AT746_00540 [Lacimicrobium alkaliphilum]